MLSIYTEHVQVMCFYKNREFIRVGYWVANTYALPLADGTIEHNAIARSHTHPLSCADFLIAAGEEPPVPAPVEHIKRAVLADKPRVTRYPIDW
jgi:hypothetical protein